MSLYLNGTKIPGHGLQVSATLTLAGEDLSGNSSSTTQAEKGDKPKTLSVHTTIRFIDADYLSQLTALAEAKTGSDERMVYNVINNTAKAMNIRQVVFQNDVQVTEQTSQRQWDVSFSLVEKRSVAEKKQAQAKDRGKTKTVTQQTAAGKTVATPTQAASSTTTQNQTPTQLTEFEKVLKIANDALK